MLWGNLNEHFGQPNTWFVVMQKFCTCQVWKTDSLRDTVCEPKTSEDEGKFVKSSRAACLTMLACPGHLRMLAHPLPRFTPHSSHLSLTSWFLEEFLASRDQHLPTAFRSELRTQKEPSSWELCLLWAKWGSCVWTYWDNLLLWMTPPSGEEPSTLLDPQAAGSGCRIFCTFWEPFWHKNSRERELLILMFKILTLR